MTDFTTITACGECCAGCSKKIAGSCPGCIEADEYAGNVGENARNKNIRYEIRFVRQEEAEEAADVERRCFPPNEACTPERMKRRIRVASDFFLVAIDPLNGSMAGFVNGIATKETKLRDEFFTDELLHDPDGPNIMILGVAVLPEYRGRGLARELISQYFRLQRERNRRMLVLTCLDDKVKMYEKFGFRDCGESSSSWGGETWHEMEAVI